MADKKQEYEMRVKQCMEAVKGIMTEARNDGLSIGVNASLDTAGEPMITVAVLLR